MKHALRLLMLLVWSLLSALEEEDISQMEVSLSAECEPLNSVAGCVNIASGQFFQVDQDLQGHTIDPLSVIRAYDSTNQMDSFIGMGMGSQFPLFATDIQKSARHSNALISERDGFLIPYYGKEKGQIHVCQIDPRLLKKGYTNTGRTSGQSNFVNWRAVYQEGPDFWCVQLGNGTKRFYKDPIKLEKEKKDEIGFPTKTMYLLKEERKANGN